MVVHYNFRRSKNKILILFFEFYVVYNGFGSIIFESGVEEECFCSIFWIFVIYWCWGKRRSSAWLCVCAYGFFFFEMCAYGFEYVCVCMCFFIYIYIYLCFVICVCCSCICVFVNIIYSVYINIICLLWTISNYFFKGKISKKSKPQNII